ARGVDARRYLAERRSVAEGFTTAAAVYELSQRRHVETPLAEQVFHVLHRGRSVQEALGLLLQRSYKRELWGLRLEEASPPST
ncbi:MAG: hypothetical protein ACOZIN_06605, partial [Myxococcota bacterium]